MNALYQYVDDMNRNWNSLRGTWDKTREGWKGIERDRFEREIMSGLNQETSKYLTSLHRLADSVQQILSNMP